MVVDCYLAHMPQGSILKCHKIDKFKSFKNFLNFSKKKFMEFMRLLCLHTAPLGKPQSATRPPL